ncbi:MAG: GNAT family N-acetyltransferase [Pseudomonadales bacterium]|nr:GNAT family N-acetyltransferase [Pseudomonadales bacterium]
MIFRVPERLTTTRLQLRPFIEADWDVMAQYYADEEITRYTSGKPLTRNESWRSIACMIGHWHIHGYGPYALEQLETGELIGVAGYWYPGGWPEPEIKWGLLKAHWGQGYASEAARSLLATAEEYLPEIPFISLIHIENQASIHLALALGATFEKEIDFWWGRFGVYRHQQRQKQNKP